MPLPIPGDLSSQAIIIFVIFILFVAVIYKLFKLAFSAAIAAAAGFSFPWVNEFLNLGLPVTANLTTSIYFAGIALLLFLGYEFLHYIIAFYKIVTWPIRSYLHGKQKKKVKKLEQEIKEIKKKK